VKPLSVITNIFLSIFLILSGFAFVTSNIIETNYLAETAKESDVYEGLTKVAKDQLEEIAKRSEVPKEKLQTKQFSALITEEYVTKKGEDLLRQLEDYRDGKTNTVQLDLSDLEAKARQNGLEIQKGSFEPFVLVDTPERQLGNSNPFSAVTVGQAVLYALTLLLFVGALVLAIVRKRFTGFAIALLVAGIILALFSLFTIGIRAILVEKINVPDDVAALNEYARTFASNIFSDITRQYAILALVGIVLSIGAFITRHIVKKNAPAETSKIKQVDEQKEEHLEAEKEEKK